MSAPWTRLASGISLAATPALPLLWAVQRADGRMGADLAERWGLQVPAVVPGSVWVHAASVGEVQACEPLVASLTGPVLLTADTDTGAQTARRLAAGRPNVVAGVRPVDHPWVLAPLWAEARPRALIFVEGAWWPSLAAMAARHGIPVLRVNGKVGRRTRLLGRAYARWMDAVQAVVARDEASAAWFRQQGVCVLGVADLKRAREVPHDAVGWRRPYAVGVSTRAGDEAALLACLSRLPADLGLVLAPRHPERFEAVWELIQGLDIEAWRRSDGPVPAEARVLLLDSIGELAGVVARAEAAFIGGTFDPRVGGHSPAEAQNAGVPVVAGPQRHSDPRAFEDAVAAASWSELADALLQALGRGRQIRQPSAGGEEVLAWLQPWLGGPPAAATAPRPWLAGVAMGVQVAVHARNGLFDRGVLGTHRLAVPVVSVGSANARGAGKTPATAWVAAQLRDRGYVVGVVVRGYRRSVAGRQVELADAPDAARLGDEGAELASMGFLVAASPDRVAAGRALVQAGAEVVVIEDGLQHRRLHRDLDLVVVDGEHVEARGALPAGERRERAVPARAHGVIWIGGEPTPAHGAVQLERREGPWFRGERPAEAPAGPVTVVCGIGRPGRFVHRVKEAVGVARVVTVPDHGDIVLEPIIQEGLPVVCTAKDAARMGYPPQVWWRRVELVQVGGDTSTWWPRLEAP